MYSEIETIESTEDINYYYLNTRGSNQNLDYFTIPDKIIICFFTPKHHSILTSVNLLDYFEEICKTQNIDKINNINSPIWKDL